MEIPAVENSWARKPQVIAVHPAQTERFQTVMDVSADHRENELQRLNRIDARGVAHRRAECNTLSAITVVNSTFAMQFRPT
jgi:hypothetical protein